ncbi:MAG TPA: RING finger protein [Ignavibacteria bacterium]|nr:RING finger protein [Ignavibacteria bacterium]
MQEDSIKTPKNICTFCQTPIKNQDEELICPSCTSPYHIECWEENKGCAVYGCGEKFTGKINEVSFHDSIINIEYLINRNQYSEAIIEAKQLLKIDRKSTELKNLYNKAVALINTKINLMTSGDEAFNRNDYKAAEIYYKNVLKYSDEIETNFINARLEISKEKIPAQMRKKVYQNILIFLIILAILSAIGYFAYYTFALKEDRDYTELVRSDRATDLKSMEQMTGKYENFLRIYSDGKYKKQVLERINQYSFKMANLSYRNDWRMALRYFNKSGSFMNDDEGKELKNNIYNEAFEEYKQKLSNAKKLNSNSKYSEALNELNNALNIISSFPGSEISNEKNIVESNMNLLNKKISSIVKVNDIDRELREKDKELGDMNSSLKSKALVISARIIRYSEQGYYITIETESKNVIALKGTEGDYKIGNTVRVICVSSGKIAYENDTGEEVSINLYTPYNSTESFYEGESSDPEKNTIYERVKNLKIQKAKIDSLLNMSLM